MRFCHFSQTPVVTSDLRSIQKMADDAGSVLTVKDHSDSKNLGVQEKHSVIAGIKNVSDIIQDIDSIIEESGIDIAAGVNTDQGGDEKIKITEGSVDASCTSKECEENTAARKDDTHSVESKTNETNGHSDSFTRIEDSACEEKQSDMKQFDCQNPIDETCTESASSSIKVNKSPVREEPLGVVPDSSATSHSSCHSFDISQDNSKQTGTNNSETSNANRTLNGSLPTDQSTSISSDINFENDDTVASSKIAATSHNNTDLPSDFFTISDSLSSDEKGHVSDQSLHDQTAGKDDSSDFTMCHIETVKSSEPFDTTPVMEVDGSEALKNVKNNEDSDARSPSSENHLKKKESVDNLELKISDIQGSEKTDLSASPQNSLKADNKSDQDSDSIKKQTCAVDLNEKNTEQMTPKPDVSEARSESTPESNDKMEIDSLSNSCLSVIEHDVQNPVIEGKPSESDDVRRQNLEEKTDSTNNDEISVDAQLNESTMTKLREKELTTSEDPVQKKTNDVRDKDTIDSNLTAVPLVTSNSKVNDSLDIDENKGFFEKPITCSKDNELPAKSENVVKKANRSADENDDDIIFIDEQKDKEVNSVSENKNEELLDLSCEDESDILSKAEDNKSEDNKSEDSKSCAEQNHSLQFSSENCKKRSLSPPETAPSDSKRKKIDVTSESKDKMEVLVSDDEDVILEDPSKNDLKHDKKQDEKASLPDSNEMSSLVKTDGKSVHLSAEALQAFFTLRVKAFVRKQKQHQLDRINRRTRGMQNASNLWKETAKHLEKTAVELTSMGLTLDQRNKQKKAVKEMCNRTIGIQVSEEKVKNVTAVVNVNPPRLPPNLLRGTVPSSPYRQSNTTQNRPVRPTQNPSGLQQYPRARFNRPPMTSAPQHPPAQSVVNLIDLTDDEENSKRRAAFQPQPGIPLSTSQQHLARPSGAKISTVNGYKLSPGMSTTSTVVTGSSSVQPNTNQLKLIGGNPPAGSYALIPPGVRAPISCVTQRPAGIQQSPAQPSNSLTTPVLPPSTLKNMKHPAPLPPPTDVNALSRTGLKIPPKPSLRISRASHGIVLSWNMPLLQGYEVISSYQLFAYQETESTPTSNLWKKVGDVKALPLPMACTLTQFQEGNKYHFAVRAIDRHSRQGPFSDPSSIFLGPQN